MARYTIDFRTRIQGIPCGIQVLNYSPEIPMKITGTGFGDAEPPEPEEFEFMVLDRYGYKADWLAKKMTEDDEIDILSQFKERYLG